MDNEDRYRFDRLAWARVQVLIAVAMGSVFAIAFGLLLWIGQARAHEALPTAAQPEGWTYPLSCCSTQDCRQAKAGEVKENDSGFRVVSTGEIVGYTDKRVKNSPDGLFHVCQQGGDFDKGRVLCLFAPPRSY